jgi:DNA polymerase-3 subunit beta
MKFTADSSALLRTLGFVSKAISQKSIQPILLYGLVRQDGDQLTITGSSTAFSLTLPLPVTILTGQEFQPFCLNVFDFMAYLKELPTGPIEITVDPGNWLTTVVYAQGEFQIPSSSADDYPQIEVAGDPDLSFSLEPSVLLPAVKQAAGFIHEDTLRPAFNCVAFNVTNEGVTLYASDGHIFYRYEHQHGVPFIDEGSPAVIGVNYICVNALAAAFADAESITIRHFAKYIEFSSGYTRLIVMNLEAKFPKYEAIIRKSSPYHIVADAALLRAVIRRMSILSPESTRLIILSRVDGGICLSSNDVEMSKSAKETILCDDVTLPDGYRIGIASTTILTTLGVIGTSDVRLELDGPDKALILRETDATSCVLSLCMPMQLTD